MSKELIVSAGRHETRVAILEDDQVVELFHEREKEYSLAGSIHKGRVTRVLPGMQSAFVDIGLDRDAFLYVSDFFEDNDEYDAVVSTIEEKVLKMGAPETDRPPVRYALPQAALAAAKAAEIDAAAAAATTVDGIAAVPRVDEAARSARPDRGAPDRGTSDRGASSDRGGDRGGRGRRGRRRGGRSGGLPESKFFSPKAGDENAGPEPEADAPEAPVEAAELPQTSEATPLAPLVAQFAAQYGMPAARSATSHSNFDLPSGEGILILPGESLAKYSAEETSAAKAPVEPASSGVGAVVSWVKGAVASWGREPEVVAIPAPVSVPAPLPEPVAEIVAAPVPVIEVPEPETVAAAIIFEEIAPPLDADEIAEVEEAAVAAETEVSEGEVAVGEPAVGESTGATSETASASVREPNERFPHRVSRRMRRKRGGERSDRPQTHNADTATAEGDSAPAIDGIPVEAGDAAAPSERNPAERGNDRGNDRNRDRHSRDRGDRPARTERTETTERPERERPPLPSISDLLKEGQEIVVQIAKEPIGQKGARITSHIALPGRFVVYMPTVEHVGVSRKIPSDEERQRLKRVLQTHRQGVPGGFICRTAAEGKTEEELRVDMHFLYNLWLDMRQKAEKKPAPVLLHHDLDLVQRILRDQLTTSFKTIWVDNEELYESVLRFVERFQPALIGRVKLYTRSNPIFDEFGVTAEVEKALRPKVWLKSGGYIVINQTEALVAIDINTGKYVGKSNRLEDTIVKINTDAIKEIVRQIRLRDLGGIIVVDFIDMDERKNRQKVMLALEEGMRADRAPYKILQFNDFGLVAITRKRVKQSLERTLCAPCSYCEGAGYLKSPATVISEILQEAQRMQKAFAADTGNVMLRVNPEVAKILKSNNNSFLQELEEIAGRTVMVKSDPLLHQTKFDLA